MIVDTDLSHLHAPTLCTGVSGSATAPVIELSDIRFSWSADLAPLLDITTLRVAKGERISLRGPSGSGKSTLLNILTGVVTPPQGSVRILGRNLNTLRGAARDRFRADHIGYIFQMFNLVPYLTVIENVCLPCGFSKRRRERAMRTGSSVEAEAVRLLQHLDMGDAALLRRPVTRLSVGQQQRVAAARALIGTPEIVIADEPTSALDADRRVAFLDLLFRQCEQEGTALVFATHDASLSPLFDRTIELADLQPRTGSATANSGAQP